MSPPAPNAATALEREVQRLARLHAGANALWPGFDPLAVPLAVFDGTTTTLFRHANPSAEFTPLSSGAPDTYAMPGRHPAVVANSSAHIGGSMTATVMLEGAARARPLAELAAMAIHESFHVFQRARHAKWAGDEASLFVYPDDVPDLLALRRLEFEALRRALAARTTPAAACWARRALALRTQRFAGMDSVYGAYERATELNEGLATYVELRALDRRAPLPAKEYGATDVRLRAYQTGAAFAQLLDRFAPRWRDALETHDAQSLDAALAAALGPGESCAFDAATTTAAAARARDDVAALGSERQQRVSAFEAAPGWRLVIEVAGGEPLWPQGFDPLNVQRVAPFIVLHTRMLKLGNAAGTLDVLGAASLSEGQGAHPLFEGVRRVVLTGLPKPDIVESGGRVTVRVPGVALDFGGATVTRSGESITVRLGS